MASLLLCFRGLVRRWDQRGYFLAPLKILAAAALTELVHLVVEGGWFIHFAVVELEIFVTPSLDVEFATQGDVVSLGNFVAVGVEDFTEIFVCFNFPFGYGFGISYPCAAVVVFGSTVMVLSIVFVPNEIFTPAFS